MDPRGPFADPAGGWLLALRDNVARVGRGLLQGGGGGGFAGAGAGQHSGVVRFVVPVHGRESLLRELEQVDIGGGGLRKRWRWARGWM